jgi:hypothetical protein
MGELQFKASLGKKLAKTAFQVSKDCDDEHLPFQLHGRHRQEDRDPRPVPGKKLRAYLKNN